MPYSESSVHPDLLYIESLGLDIDEVMSRPNIAESLQLDPEKIDDDDYYANLDEVPDGDYKYEGKFPSIGLGEDFGELLPITVGILPVDIEKTDPLIGEKITPGTKVANVGGYTMNLGSLKYLLTTQLVQSDVDFELTLDDLPETSEPEVIEITEEDL